MKIAQFRDNVRPHISPRVFEEGDVSAALPMYARISEWVEVEFPQLPAEDYLPRQLQYLEHEERVLLEKLGKVNAARNSLQNTPAVEKQIYVCMHCRFDMVIEAPDPEDMVVVPCKSCGGSHHLRQGILTAAYEVPAKVDVIADSTNISSRVKYGPVNKWANLLRHHVRGIFRIPLGERRGR
jgi:hypothetical protein